MSRRRQKAAYHRQLVITNPRRLSTFFIILAVLLVAIPQIAQSPKLKVQSADPKLNGQMASGQVIKSLPDTGPIKIDAKLLSSQEAAQPPLRIVIPQYNIDLPVIEAPVIDGVWETSDTTASHGEGSADPGQIGNSVIFAHARVGLFLPLRNIKVGDDIYVLTKDRWYRYSVSTSQLVTPDQVQVISQTADERLTLFTCSGFFDEKRLIVTALPDRP